MTTISTNEKDFIKSSLKEQLRFDGRRLLDHRNISIAFGNSLGSVELKLGGTKVVSKIVATLEEPKKERPNEGFVKFNVDLAIMEFNKQANEIYDKDKYQNEVAKILEKIIKGSKALDIESLCILTGKCAWNLQVNLTLLNNEGNLIDAFYLCAILSLLHYKKPQVAVQNLSKIVVFGENEKKPHPLSIHHIPIAFTFAFFNDSETVIMDPIKEEEDVMDGRLTIAVNIYKEICLIHKPGGAPLQPEIFAKLLDVCNLKVAEITNIIRDVLKNSEENTLANLKNKTKVHLISGNLPQSEYKLEDIIVEDNQQGLDDEADDEQEDNKDGAIQDENDEDDQIDTKELQKTLEEQE